MHPQTTASLAVVGDLVLVDTPDDRGAHHGYDKHRNERQRPHRRYQSLSDTR